MMRCIKCGLRTGVIDSRPKPRLNTVVRRRECVSPRCGYRFSTYEVVMVNDAAKAALANEGVSK